VSKETKEPKATKEKKVIPDFSLAGLIGKEYGKDLLISGDAIKVREGKKISMGLSLDIATRGGLPEGCTFTFSGITGCGKTTLALTILANAQAMGKNVYYIDIEHRIRTELLQCIKGLDVDKFNLIKSNEDKFLSAEDNLNIIDSIFSNDKGCVVVLDSVAMLAGEGNLATKLGDSKAMAAIPKIMYDFFRKIIAKVNAYNSNLILISHLQANVGGYGGPKEVGGFAQQFSASTRIMCYGSQEFPKEGTKLGRVSQFKIPKSATSAPSEAEFYIRYGQGYDYARDLAENAKNLGLVEQSGAWFKVLLKPFEEVKAQGIESLVDELNSNTELAAALDKEVRRLAGI